MNDGHHQSGAATDTQARGPAHGPPTPGHARTILVYSLAASWMVAGFLLFSSLLGLTRHDVSTPWTVTVGVMAVLVALAAWERAQGTKWHARTDSRVAALVLTIDTVAGAVIVYLTGGPESALVILIPIAPFALRLLAGVWHSIAYGLAVLGGFAVMILLRAGGVSHPQGILPTSAAHHGTLEILLAGTVVGSVFASSLLADRIARVLAQREQAMVRMSRRANSRAQELELLFKIGTALSRGTNFDEVAREALACVHDHFEPAATVLYVVDPPTGRLSAIGALGEEAAREEEESTLALATIGTGSARLWPTEVPGEARGRSSMVAPLFFDGQAYGAVKLVAPEGVKYSRDDLGLLSSAAGELTVTLRTAESYRAANVELSAVSSELSALTAFTRRVSSSFDVDAMADDLLATALRYTRSDYGSVTLTGDSGGRTVTRYANYPPHAVDDLSRGDWRRRTGGQGRAIQTGRPVLISDLRDEPEADSSPADVKSKLVVPVLVEGAVEGTLTLESRNRGHYAPSDLDFVVALADSAGIALNNSRLYNRCREMAVRDGLTGLYDRSFFQETIDTECARSRRHGREVALLFIDVDDFKSYNDTHGHPAGDDVMRWLGSLLRQETRGSDIVARYGGEEFAVIMSETSVAEAAEAAEKIRRLVEHRQPAAWPRRVTVSIGVAACPGDAPGSVGLIEAADRRLYAAKREGKNCVVSCGEDAVSDPPGRAALPEPTPSTR